MLQVNDLALSFNGENLFSGANLIFQPGNCYGVIGAIAIAAFAVLYKYRKTVIKLVKAKLGKKKKKLSDTTEE